MVLGGTAPSGVGNLDLTATDLAALQNGFSSIVLGRSDGSGKISLGGNITFNDPVTFRSPATSGSINTTGFTVTGADNATINFVADANIATGNILNPGRSIALNSSNGSIDTSNAILNTSSANSSGGTINFTAKTGINLGAIDTSTAATSSTASAGILSLNSSTGNILLNGDINTSAVTGSGSNLNFNNNASLAKSLTINTGGNAGSGSIIFNNYLDGTTAGSQNLILNAGTGNIAFSGAIGGSTSVGNLTANSTGSTLFNGVSAASLITNAGGTTQFNRNVNTIGQQTYGDAVVIANNPILTGTEIAFGNTVNGNSNLTVNAGTGNITFNGAIGNSTPLNNLTANSTGTTVFNAVSAGSLTTDAGGKTQLNANVNTTGNQTYRDAAIIANNPILTGSNITFNSTLDGDSNLTVNSGTGNVEFKGPIGNSTPLNNLTANSTGTTVFNAVSAGSLTTDAGGKTQLNANVNTTGNQTYRDAVTIANNPVLASKGINFNSTLDGNSNLTVDAGTGNVGFNGAIGNISRLGNLTVNSASAIDSGKVAASSINFTASNTIATGNLDTSSTAGNGGKISLFGNSGIATGDINASSSSGNGGEVRLKSAIGSTVAGNINTSGSSGGAVDAGANGAIAIGQINSSGTSNSGGSLTLNTSDHIRIVSINAQGGTASSGGSINVTAGNLFRSTGTFTDQNGINASISTNGGAITLQHGGGTATPFTIGDATTNGTAGAIVSGTNNAIVPDLSVPVPPGTYTQGNINIITNAPTPAPAPSPIPPAPQPGVTPQPQPGVNPQPPTNSLQSQPGESGQPSGSPVNNQPGRSANTSETSNETTNSNSTATATSENHNLNSGALENRNILVVENHNQSVSGDANSQQTLRVESTGDRVVSGDITNDRPIETQQILRIQTNSSNILAAPRSSNSSASVPATPSAGDSTNQVSAINSPDSNNYNSIGISNTSNPASITLARASATQTLDSGKVENAVVKIEQLSENSYSNYLGENISSESPISVQSTRETLSKIESQTGNRSAIIYAIVRPEQLDLILFSANKTVHRTVRAANRQALLETVRNLRSEITNPRKRKTTSYLASAQKLYQWLIKPLETELQNQKIDTLLFNLDAGLRALPIAVLHDGQQFLVEKYSISLIPSISLTDTRYQSLANARVLAMGASVFADKSPLPAVSTELQNITTEWPGKSFLNQDFTLNNLRSQRAATASRIIHLATHGEFSAGPNNSYIQLWDTKLLLSQLRHLGWNNPPVELLVLSACRTALGDEQAELGFAGFAVQAGVKSVLASLWYVSDEGSLALMTDFYSQLRNANVKSEALQQTQIAMIRGKVNVESGQLRGINFVESGVTPPSANSENRSLSHPFYWSGFTMIGSPW
ncbi:MAG: CHAT domain-containing protein [Microcoleus sp. CSU_2_2]|nr:CHAT domain-containing protein [Microcoleus sp. CSU_2_2]